MSTLPIVTAKRYDYGAYARPQQVQYKGGVGEGIAAGLTQAGQAFAKAGIDKVNKARERERLIEANKDKIAMTLATENPELFKLNQQAVMNFVDTVIPRETDSRAEKNAKIAKYGSFMAKFKAIDDFSERENPIGEDSGDLIAAGSILDNYGHDVIRNNKLEFEFNEETGEIDFFITYPEEAGLSKGGLIFANRRQVDPLKLISSEIQTKYYRDIDMEEFKLNRTPPQLAALLVQNSKYEAALGDKRTVDGITSQSFDAGKLADIFKNDYSDKNPTAIGISLKNLARKKGATIWNQYFEEENGDWTGSDEQKKMVYDYVAQDVATKYSNSIVKQYQAKQEDPFEPILTARSILKDVRSATDDFPGGPKDGITSDEVANILNNHELVLGSLGKDIEIVTRAGIIEKIDSRLAEAEKTVKELAGNYNKTDREKVQARIDELKQYRTEYAKRPSDHLFYMKDEEVRELNIFNKVHDDSKRVLKGRRLGKFGVIDEGDKKLISVNDFALVIENIMKGSDRDRRNIITTLVTFKPQAEL